VPEDRRHRAALPAPLGAVGDKDGIVADHGSKRPAGRRVAAEGIGLLDQNFADQVGIADQKHIGIARTYPREPFLVGRAWNRLDIIAP